MNLGRWIAGGVLAGSAWVAGCGSSSNGNNNCTTETAMGGIGLGGGAGSTCNTANSGAAAMCESNDPTNACFVCLAASCCSQSLACGEDAACNACTTAACFQNSDQAGTNLLNCAEVLCKTQCDL